MHPNCCPDMDRLTSIVEQIKASSALERERGLLSLRQLFEGAIKFYCLQTQAQATRSERL